MRISPRTRRLLLASATLLALVLVAYAGNRALSPWMALRIVATDTPPAAEAARDGDMRPPALRIGCYNIAHGRGSGESNFNGEDRDARLRRLREIAQFLEEAALDVVVLNEVDFDSSWSGRVNQAEYLAQQAGFPYRVEQRNFDVVVPFFRLRFGNAVLSRWPIVEAEMVDLPGDAAWEMLLAGKKTACICTIERPGGERMRMVPVHLSYRSETVRTASAEAIRREASRGNVPTLIAGDFNSTPMSFPQADPSGLCALAVLTDREWTTLPAAPPSASGLTFSSMQPDRVIDWILAPKPWVVESIEVPAIELSDHRPVIGVVRMMDKP